MDTMIGEKAAERKKYLKLRTSNWQSWYTIKSIKKNLKNVIDLINLFKFSYSNPSRYKDFIKLILVESKTTQKNKKIIFRGRSNLISRIFDFK